MTYTLDLFFAPPVRRDRMHRYFAGRRYYEIDDDAVSYEHPDTGVYFSIKLRCGKNALFQSVIVSAEFEINYYRPSFFGIEAERELSALVNTFQSRINDDQMYGMGEGPYSREGFLSGWNFGNVFSVHNALADDFETQSMAAENLLAAWAWNYDCDRRRNETNRYFIPRIDFFVIEGRLSRVVLWTEGMPVSLPRADYVLIGRLVSGQKRFGLAAWSEVLDLAKQSGFDVTQNPLNMEYFRTPPSIKDWFSSRPLIDLDALRSVEKYRILDDELIVAAREFEDRIASQVDGD